MASTIALIFGKAFFLLLVTCARKLITLLVVISLPILLIQLFWPGFPKFLSKHTVQSVHALLIWFSPQQLNLQNCAFAIMSFSLIYEFGIFLLSWITSQTCRVMSFRDISKLLSMTRVDISMSRFTPTPKSSLVFRGGGIIFPFPPYLCDGKQVPFYTIMLALLSPVPRSLWEFPSQSMLMTDVGQLFLSGPVVA